MFTEEDLGETLHSILPIINSKDIYSTYAESIDNYVSNTLIKINEIFIKSLNMFKSAQDVTNYIFDETRVGIRFQRELLFDFFYFTKNTDYSLNAKSVGFRVGDYFKHSSPPILKVHIGNDVDLTFIDLLRESVNSGNTNNASLFTSNPDDWKNTVEIQSWLNHTDFNRLDVNFSKNSSTWSIYLPIRRGLKIKCFKSSHLYPDFDREEYYSTDPIEITIRPGEFGIFSNKLFCDSPTDISSSSYTYIQWVVGSSEIDVNKIIGNSLNMSQSKFSKVKKIKKHHKTTTIPDWINLFRKNGFVHLSSVFDENSFNELKMEILNFSNTAVNRFRNYYHTVKRRVSEFQDKYPHLANDEAGVTMKNELYGSFFDMAMRPGGRIDFVTPSSNDFFFPFLNSSPIVKELNKSLDGKLLFKSIFQSSLNFPKKAVKNWDEFAEEWLKHLNDEPIEGETFGDHIRRTWFRIEGKLFHHANNRERQRWKSGNARAVRFFIPLTTPIHTSFCSFNLSIVPSSHLDRSNELDFDLHTDRYKLYFPEEENHYFQLEQEGLPDYLKNTTFITQICGQVGDLIIIDSRLLHHYHRNTELEQPGLHVEFLLAKTDFDLSGFSGMGTSWLLPKNTSRLVNQNILNKPIQFQRETIPFTMETRESKNIDLKETDEPSRDKPQSVDMNLLLQVLQMKAPNGVKIKRVGEDGFEEINPDGKVVTNFKLTEELVNKYSTYLNKINNADFKKKKKVNKKSSIYSKVEL